MPSNSFTFVLVHGLWHGGWCWRPVAERLREQCHQVTTPTLTGLGERSHLRSAEITLDTFVDDLVNHLRWEDLHNVILVGHSFGGAVITGAADRAPERIGKLIYLDGAVMESGETWMQLLDPAIVEQRLAAARAFDGGISLPPAPPEFFGVSDSEQAAFLQARLTPHPMRTMTTPLELNQPTGNGLDSHFIACTDPLYPTAQLGARRARAKGWTMHELPTGHDAMITAPQATAALLERLGAM